MLPSNFAITSNPVLGFNIKCNPVNISRNLYAYSPFSQSWFLSIYNVLMGTFICRESPECDGKALVLGKHKVA